MAAGPLHVLLVLLHIILVTVWFGLALRLQFLSRALGGGGPLAGSEEIRQAGNRTVQVMTVSIILFYAAAIANFFVGGGFAVFGANFHASLLLGMALVIVVVLVVQPAWGRLSGGQPADAKRVAMGIGIGHGLWLVLLVLMFWPYGGLRRAPEAAPATTAPAAAPAR